MEPLLKIASIVISAPNQVGYKNRIFRGSLRKS